MAKKASEHVTYYKNTNGPLIGTVSRMIIEKDGLYFKDLDGSGEFKAYAEILTVDEKLAQLFISD